MRRNDVQAVVYDDDMLDMIDGILAGAAQVLLEAKARMQLFEEEGTDVGSDTVEVLAAMRDEMAMRLARYERGLWIPSDSVAAAQKLEKEATSILGILGLDRPDYEHPMVRECQRKVIESLVR